MDSWIPNDVFFSRRKFITAKRYLPLVTRTLTTDRSRMYEVEDESIILDNLKMTFSCTCKEGTLHGHKGTLCPHVIAVLVKEVLGDD